MQSSSHGKQPSTSAMEFKNLMTSGQSILLFLLKRILVLLITLLVVTMLLFAAGLIFPPEQRASFYGPNDGFFAQYLRWLQVMATGQWGYSSTAMDFVLPALLRLSPATAELALYSILAFIPLGLISGLIAGRRQNSRLDQAFQFTAFIATSIPPFILAIFLLGVFYVGVRWFPPGRLDDTLRLFVASGGFKTYTGLLTVDGLLNGRPDVSLEALRHLVLPVITLSLYHWATLARVTRVTVGAELGKDYVLAAKARGVSDRRVLWVHALRNAMVPILNNTMLSASSLFTGVFVVEAIFNYGGVSKLVRNALYSEVPDIPAALGFAVYSVLVVLFMMTLLDILQGLVDPRLRESDGSL